MTAPSLSSLTLPDTRRFNGRTVGTASENPASPRGARGRSSCTRSRRVPHVRLSTDPNDARIEKCGQYLERSLFHGNPFAVHAEEELLALRVRIDVVRNLVVCRP